VGFYDKIIIIKGVYFSEFRGQWAKFLLSEIYQFAREVQKNGKRILVMEDDMKFQLGEDVQIMLFKDFYLEITS